MHEKFAPLAKSIFMHFKKSLNVLLPNINVTGTQTQVFVSPNVYINISNLIVLAKFKTKVCCDFSATSILQL